MLTLLFRMPGASRRLFEVEWIEFRGAVMHTSIHSEPLAHYDSGNWLHGGTGCLVVECSGILSIQLEAQNGNAGPVLGPFPAMRIRDRHLFGGRARIAKLAPVTGRWATAGVEAGWSVLRVFPRLAHV